MCTHCEHENSVVSMIPNNFTSKKNSETTRRSAFSIEYRMNVNVLLLSLALWWVSHVACEPLHQSASNQRGLQFLMKTLMFLTNHSGKVKKSKLSFTNLG